MTDTAAPSNEGVISDGRVAQLSEVAVMTSSQVSWDGLQASLREALAALRREREELSDTREVARWAQAVLTAMNIGHVLSGSALHLKLREVMIAYRAKARPEGSRSGG